MDFSEISIIQYRGVSMRTGLLKDIGLFAFKRKRLIFGFFHSLQKSDKICFSSSTTPRENGKQLVALERKVLLQFALRNLTFSTKPVIAFAECFTYLFPIDFCPTLTKT